MFGFAAQRRQRFMTNVAASFQSFLSGLELTKTERDEAVRQHQVVRARLESSLGGIRTTLLMGSYRRGTAIRPLDDIDVFVVLDEARHGGLSPTPLLQRVEVALRRAYPEHKPRIQGRSVNIEFAGTGIGYDIVPAFAVGSTVNDEGEPQEFEIPDRQQEAWIKTNPRHHRSACVEANERAVGMLNGLIKAAKSWNRAQDIALTSFHVEVMSYGAFVTKPDDPRRGLKLLFEYLASAVMKPCPDPAGLGPDLDAKLSSSERAAARDLLQRAATVAAHAVFHEGTGNAAGAVTSWQQLLGPDFRAVR